MIADSLDGIGSCRINEAGVVQWAAGYSRGMGYLAACRVTMPRLELFSRGK